MRLTSPVTVAIEVVSPVLLFRTQIDTLWIIRTAGIVSLSSSAIATIA
jgi:hypothetical protein